MLKDVLHTLELHIKRAESAKKEILEWGDFSKDVFTDEQKIKTIDSFIFRYIKLQDLTGQKLFKLFLDEIGDFRDDMSLLDILDRLEKLEVVESSETWMGYRKLRNVLTHEYPDNEDEIVEGLKLALDAFNTTLVIIENIKKRISSSFKGLS
ncbi:MAG: hypothetical protein JXR86_13035 [Spirochaetales bacterium]|nr:hypothetical protein [Spirochaetales bacterium]